MPTDPKPQGIDKMPLKDFVYSVLTQYAEAVDQFEKDRIRKVQESGGTASLWQGADADMIARAVLKPMKMSDGTTQVWIDIDEPSTEQRTDIPISLRRRQVAVKSDG